MTDEPQYEYRIATLGEHDEKPSYGLGEAGDIYVSQASAQSGVEELRKDFAEVWLERRPVNPLPWERVP